VQISGTAWVTRKLAVALLAALALFAFQLADAHTRAAAATCTAIASGIWSNPSTWACSAGGGPVPTGTDSVVIASHTVIVNSAVPTITGTVTLTGTAPSLAVQPGASLSSGAVVNSGSGPSSIAMSGGSWTTSGTTTLSVANATMTISGGTYTTPPGSAGEVTVAGSLTVSGGTLAGGPDVSNNGIFTLSAGEADIHSYGPSFFASPPVMGVGSTGTLRIQSTFQATGFTAAGGTVIFDDGSNENSSIDTSGALDTFFNLVIDTNANGNNRTMTLNDPMRVINNFTIASGTFAAGGSNPSQEYDGNFSNSGTYSGGSSSATFGGGTAQQIQGTSATTFGALMMSSAGVTLNLSGPATTTTVGGSLIFTSGKITTGASTFVAEGAVSGAGNLHGYVVGNLQRPMVTSPVTFDVGGSPAGSWTPITFTGLSGAGSLAVSTTASAPATLANSAIDATHKANRAWTVTPIGTVTGSYTAAVTYLGSDLDAGSVLPNFVVNRYDGTNWVEGSSSANSGTTTATQGFPAFGAGTYVFAVGTEKPADNLAFAVQPSDVVLGASITPAVTVQVRTANNFVATKSGASVTMAIGANPGFATLGGTTTVAATNGVAMFAGLTLDSIGTGYTLNASSSGLTGRTSNPFNVTPPATCTSIISGAWNNPSTWACSAGGGPIPTGTDAAVIGVNTTVIVNSAVPSTGSIAVLGSAAGPALEILPGASLSSGSVTITGTHSIVTMSGGSWTTSGITTIQAGAFNSMTISGGTYTTPSGSAGTVTVGGSLTVSGGTLAGSPDFTNNGIFTLSSGEADVHRYGTSFSDPPVMGVGSTGTLRIQTSFQAATGFTAAGGTVIFDDGSNENSSIDTLGSLDTFFNLVIDTNAHGNNRTTTLNDPIRVINNFTISSGTFAAGGSNPAQEFDGNFTNHGTYTGQSSPVTLAGIGTLTGPTTFFNVNVVGQTVFKDDVTVGLNLTMTGGTLSVDLGKTLTVGGNVAIQSGGRLLGTVGFTPLIQIAGNLTIASGGIFIPNAATTTVAGNWSNSGAFNPGNGLVVFNGVSLQSLTGATTFNNLTVNDIGLTINSTTTVTPAGTISLANGLVRTNANTLILGLGTTVSRANGWVNGNVQKAFTTGSGQSFTFPIGDSSNYRPVSLSGLGVTAPGTLRANETTAQHPNINTSGIDPTRDVAAYWTLTPSGLVASGYNAMFQYAPSDVIGGADESSFVVRKFASGWSAPPGGSSPDAVNHASTGSGFTSFGDYAVGQVDTTPPTTTLATSPATPDGDNNWFKQASVSFTLSATGGGSGIANSFFTVDGGPTQTYVGPVTINTQGDHTVTFWSTSNAGSVESTRTTHIKLDNVNPAGSLGIDSGATYTTSTSVTLNLNASDATSMVVSYRAAQASDCSSATFVAPFTAVSPYSADVPFTLLPGDGSKTVCVQYKDEAGNISSNATQAITLDQTSASSSDDNDHAWHNADYTVHLSATDATSGVNDIEYSVDGGPTQTVNGDNTGVTIHAPADHSSDGLHVISYFAIDNAGNSETAHATTVKIDTGEPSSLITFPVNGTDYNASTYSAGCGTVAGDICGTASDPLAGPATSDSGPNLVEVSVEQNSSGLYWNGSSFSASSETWNPASTSDAWAHWSLNLASPPDGTYTIHSRATDASGNVESTLDAATFVYDATSPSVTINQASGQADPANTSPVHFTVVFSEPVTGFGNSSSTITSTTGGTLATSVTQIAPNDGTTYDLTVSGMTSAGTVTVTLAANKANDAAGNGNTASTSIDNTVTWQPSTGNTTPVVAISSPASGSVYAKGAVAINSLKLTASFTDPDNGPWTYSVNWDDNGATSTGSLATSGQTFQPLHAFSGPGVYTITVNVKDAQGAVGTASVWIVVYDPLGGFVTGGGWINVAAGSYTANPTLSGRADFQLSSQYKKNATVPTGDSELNFQIGNMDFQSTSYNWLVVAGYKAQYKGTGTINGAGSYSFTLTAYDGDLAAGNIAGDEFRIQITDNNNHNAVVFDNRNGSPTDIDSANPQLIGGGSIVIHKA
jgi:hypothetical protein